MVSEQEYVVEEGEMEMAGEDLPPPPRPPATAIVVQYRTGWDAAFVHCCMDNKEWTQLPGECCVV
jgi:hypothetical protein